MAGALAPGWARVLGTFPAVMGMRILSGTYWLASSLVALALFPIAVALWAVTRPFDRRGVVLHAFTNVWGSIYTWINPVWSVRIRGRELIDGSPCVMVSNHLSLVDIFVMHRLFRHFKWVSKLEVFKLPVIGWNMRLNGYVPLRRGNRDSVLEMFARCRAALATGSPIMMFPEGTRSRTGQLKPFKPGAFELAKEASVPLQPIVVQGTFHAMPATGLLVGPARMRVTVLPKIPLDRVEALSVEELSDLARGRIAEQLERDQWPPEAD